MENKLINVAALLPKAELEFTEIEKTAKSRKQEVRKPTGFLRVAVAVVIILCFATTGYAYGKVRYGLWSGMTSRGYGDVELLNWQYDYEFPDNLYGSPFIYVSSSYGAPHGAGHLEALLKPTYKLYSITYGMELWEDRDEVRHYWTEKVIHVSFGTTENENWKYHFSVAEDGKCNHEDVVPGSQSTIEYNGYVLHRYHVGDTDNIRWVDEERKLVIDVTVWDDSMDILEIVQKLIDTNR